MSSILDKFPGLTYNDIRVVPYEARFNATVGAVTAGKFTWSVANGNSDSFAHKAFGGNYYYIDNVTFTSDINQLLFSNALDNSFQEGFFNLTVLKRLENTPANQSLIKFASFQENMPLGLSYGTQKTYLDQVIQAPTAEQIDFRVTGQLIQTNDIVLLGKTEIDIYVNCVIYEIMNQAWVSKYFLTSSSHRIN